MIEPSRKDRPSGSENERRKKPAGIRERTAAIMTAARRKSNAPVTLRRPPQTPERKSVEASRFDRSYRFAGFPVVPEAGIPPEAPGHRSVYFFSPLPDAPVPATYSSYDIVR